MSKHRVKRPFPAGAQQLHVGQVIDTTNSPARNIQSLVEDRFLEPVPDDTPVTEVAAAPGSRPASGRGQGSAGK